MAKNRPSSSDLCIFTLRPAWKRSIGRPTCTSSIRTISSQVKQDSHGLRVSVKSSFYQSYIPPSDDFVKDGQTPEEPSVSVVHFGNAIARSVNTDSFTSSHNLDTLTFGDYLLLLSSLVSNSVDHAKEHFKLRYLFLFSFSRHLAMQLAPPGEIWPLKKDVAAYLPCDGEVFDLIKSIIICWLRLKRPLKRRWVCFKCVSYDWCLCTLVLATALFVHWVLETIYVLFHECRINLLSVSPLQPLDFFGMHHVRCTRPQLKMPISEIEFHWRGGPGKNRPSYHLSAKHENRTHSQFRTFFLFFPFIYSIPYHSILSCLLQTPPYQLPLIKMSSWTWINPPLTCWMPLSPVIPRANYNKSSNSCYPPICSNQTTI